MTYALVTLALDRIKDYYISQASSSTHQSGPTEYTMSGNEIYFSPDSSSTMEMRPTDSMWK